MNLTLIFSDWMKYSPAMFPEATAKTSLEKLKVEIKELEEKLADPDAGAEEILEEYADCFMTLLHSMSQLEGPARNLINFVNIFVEKAKTNYRRQ